MILFLSCSLCARARNEKFFSSEKEISSNLCNHIFQDSKGYVWIATEDGLNKFDGINFTIYRNNGVKSGEIRNNYINTLNEDTKGRLWIGTCAGLQLYNRLTDSFKDVIVRTNSEVAYPFVTSIVESFNKDVWVATSGNGIIIVRNNVTLDHLKTDTKFSQLLRDDHIEKLFEDSSGRMWISTKSKGLFYFNSRTNRLTAINNGHCIINDATDMCEDYKGNIFVSTRISGLYRLGPKDKTFELVPYKQGYNSIKIVSLLSLNKKKALLVGSDGQGMKEFDYSTKTLVDSQPTMTMFDFSKAKIHCLLSDKDDNLWLGLFQKGVLLLSGNSCKFDYYGYKSVKHNSIGSCCILSIFVDKRGVVWVGTDNDGIYAIDGKGNQLKHFNNNPNDIRTVPPIIECIYEDSESNLWVGSFLGGMGKVDKNTGAFDRISDLYKLCPEEYSNSVSCIVEGDNKDLWIGTFGSGFFRRNLKTGAIMRYSTESKSDIPQNWITCLMKDRKGNIWIGTNTGLGCFDKSKGAFVNYKRDLSLFKTLGIFSLYEDEKGYLWVGTVDGLYRYSPSRRKYVHYTVRNGLPDNTICGIQEDEHHDLWISTHHGLSKYVRDGNRFYNYNTSDGIQGAEFWYKASFKDRKGRLYFGGSNGITAFNPDDIISTRRRPIVSLANFYVSGNQISIGELLKKNEDVGMDINNVDDITLEHNENTFSLEFTTFEFANPERIYYRYRILELGNKWSITREGINIITYSELDPGSYTLQVQAVDLNEISNIKTFHIHISHPWYSSWWAFCLWGLLITGLVIYLYLSARAYIAQREELNKKKNAEQINEAKLQFFMNLSHELRTPLTLITSPLEKLLSCHDSNYEVYKVMYRNSLRILSLVNQLLDIRKIDKGHMPMHFQKIDMVKFIDDIVSYFSFQAKNKHITFAFLHDEGEVLACVDPRNFDKVLINILSNAFKYTDEFESINIRLQKVDETMVIKVEDTGIGIDEDKTKLVFERFYQINNMQSNANFGTGIGLHLSKLLVELHHGTIEAERRTDVAHGSRFIIRMPVDNQNALNAIKDERIEKASVLPMDAPLTGTMVEDENMPGVEHFTYKNKYDILIVEDEDDIRKYLMDELSCEYNVASCADGKEALNYILLHKPDLVVSDIMMPVMDGMELCKAVKRNSNTYHIPVILLTAKSTMENRLEGLGIGADAYIEKPFNVKLLKGEINSIIDNRNLIKKRQNSEDIIESEINPLDLKSNDEIIMERIMAAINDNISNPDFNVDILAESVGLSRAHLYRKVKDISHTSVKNLIRDIRLKQAAKLLKKRGLSISEVAYSVGFSNVNYFATVFKEVYGKTPKDARNADEY